MTERSPDSAPVGLTVATGQTQDNELQFMIALENLFSGFATRLNDDAAFERVVMHMAEKWGCHRLPKDF